MHYRSLTRPSEKPWLTIIVHDMPKPAQWLDTLDLLIDAASSPAARHRVQLVFETDRPQGQEVKVL